MRAAILGAGGTIGPAIARDLAASEEVDALALLDIDEARAAAVAEAIDGASAARVDARAAPDEDGSLAEALRDVDVLVNSASYRVNLDAMQACLQAGCHYLDLGGLYRVTAEQIGRFAPPGGQDQFAEGGLLAVLGIGSSPGKTNLLAVRAAGELDAVEALHVSAAGRDFDPPAGFSLPYSLRTLLDELTIPPVVIRDGEAIEIEPLADGGSVDFGDPIGVGETINTLHSEMLTFPDSFGCREGSFRLSLAPELLERLRELVGASDEQVQRVQAEASPPSASTVAVHLVEGSGGGRTVRARSVTRPVPGLGLGGGVVSTAAPAAATVRLLARGRVETRGVHPPERCLDPDDVFAELEQRGSEFSVEVAEEAPA